MLTPVLTGQPPVGKCRHRATHALRGLVVAGTPLLEEEFVRETATGKAEEAQCAVTTILTAPLPAQAKWAVLQGSLQHKVTHLPRVALVGKAVTDIADAVADAALAIGNCQVQPGSDPDKRARAVEAAHASRWHGAPPTVPC